MYIKQQISFATSVSTPQEARRAFWEELPIDKIQMYAADDQQTQDTVQYHC